MEQSNSEKTSDCKSIPTLRASADVPYDDHEILKSYSTFRVCKVAIYWQKDQSIKGVQFTYEVISPNGDKIHLDGYKMMNSDITGDTEILTQVLEDGEYIVEMWGRKGPVYDQLGFKTSKSKSFYIGGTSGDQFMFKAPDGSHLCCFEGLIGDCDHSLCGLTSDFQIIPMGH